MLVQYGTTPPSDAIIPNGYTRYVDLTVDWLYDFEGGVWVLKEKNGRPVDENGELLNPYDFM